MMSQLEFLQSFIEDLLDLRQLKNGEFTLVNQAFNVAQVVTHVCNIFQPQATSKGILIETQFKNAILP